MSLSFVIWIAILLHAVAVISAGNIINYRLNSMQVMLNTHLQWQYDQQKQQIEIANDRLVIEQWRMRNGS